MSRRASAARRSAAPAPAGHPPARDDHDQSSEHEPQHQIQVSVERGVHRIQRCPHLQQVALARRWRDRAVRDPKRPYAVWMSWSPALRNARTSSGVKCRPSGSKPGDSRAGCRRAHRRSGSSASPPGRTPPDRDRSRRRRRRRRRRTAGSRAGRLSSREVGVASASSCRASRR